jgi:hypothetical protein
MTTYNIRQGGSARAQTLNPFSLDEAVLDCSLKNLTAADVVSLFDALTGEITMAMMMEVLTPEGTTLTVDVGITGAVTDGFIDGANGDATAGTVVASNHIVTIGTTAANVIIDLVDSVYSMVGGFLHEDDDVIAVIVNDNCATAKLRFTRLFCNMRGAATFGVTPA